MPPSGCTRRSSPATRRPPSRSPNACRRRGTDDRSDPDGAGASAATDRSRVELRRTDDLDRTPCLVDRRATTRRTGPQPAWSASRGRPSSLRCRRDRHSLPTTMAAVALRADHWHVHHLGADLPPDRSRLLPNPSVQLGGHHRHQPRTRMLADAPQTNCVPLARRRSSVVQGAPGELTNWRAARRLSSRRVRSFVRARCCPTVQSDPRWTHPASPIPPESRA